MNENLWIFLCTHGRFGEELINSAKMIAGEVNDVYSFGLTEGMDPFEYMSLIEEKLKVAPGKVLCLVDLFGGTPSNTCLILSRKYNIDVVTGLNLAMYIEMTSQKDNMKYSDLIECGIETLKKSGRNATGELKEKKNGASSLG